MNWTMIIPESTWFVIFLFQVAISIGLVAIWNYRCIQVNKLKEENRDFEENNMEKIKKKKKGIKKIVIFNLVTRVLSLLIISFVIMRIITNLIK